MATREFDIGDILSITTGRLVSPRGITGVYDILDFIFGSAFMTHELPVAGEHAKPILLEQHPQLSECDASGVDRDTWIDWLAEQKRAFGSPLPVNSTIEVSSADIHEQATEWAFSRIGTGIPQEEA